MKELKTLIVNGNEYTVTDPNAARIDDALVGQATWSGRNIVDRLCPAFSESGAVAVCSPVAGYPLEVVSHIQPVQADSGYSQIKLTRCGKNLLDIAKKSSIAATVNGNVIRVTKTAGGNRSSGDIPIYIPANTNFTVSGKLLGASGATTDPWTLFVITDTNKWHGIGPSYVSADGTFTWNRTFADAITKFGIYVSAGEEAGVYVELTDLQVELSKKTHYEPYRGDTFTLELGQSVYSGSFNWQTGVLTTPDGSTQQLEAREILALPGTNNLYSSTGDTVVSGRADPTAVIEKLTNAMIAQGGNI